jgi:histidyl-tRNA synthetase
MAKDKKTPRPRAETPKGFRDYFGADVTTRAEMLAKIAAVYHRYGFDALESSAVETVEALGKFLPDVDRPNAGVFAWQEDAEHAGENAKPGDWLALRYDLTAPLARVYAQHRNDLPLPYRRYAMGPVWRNEKPGPGTVPAVLSMRCRYGGCRQRGRRCRDLRDAGRYAGRGGHPARRLHRAGEQPQGAERYSHEVMGLPPVDEGDYPRGFESVLRTIDKYDKVGEAGVRRIAERAAGRVWARSLRVGLDAAQADPVIAFLTSQGR